MSNIWLKTVTFLLPGENGFFKPMVLGQQGIPTTM
jgi:hypothetical protein